MYLYLLISFKIYQIFIDKSLIFDLIYWNFTEINMNIDCDYYYDYFDYFFTIKITIVFFYYEIIWVLVYLIIIAYINIISFFFIFLLTFLLEF
jgi:hypothetical protein